MNTAQPRDSFIRFRIRAGLILVFIGLFAFVLGAAPGAFNLDRSPVTGIVQLLVFLGGLGLICMGGYITLNALWNGHEKTIGADIGLRLIGTGYVISVASGMADVFGFGTHPYPNIPYFGPLQILGVILGEVTIIIGFILLIPRRKDLEEKFGE